MARLEEEPCIAPALPAADPRNLLAAARRQTNLYALVWITKAAMPHLGAGASIIATTSQQAYDPAPYLLDYAPTKAAIIAFTKALAKQVAARGIRVNAVSPPGRSGRRWVR